MIPKRLHSSKRGTEKQQVCLQCSLLWGGAAHGPLRSCHLHCVTQKKMAMPVGVISGLVIKTIPPGQVWSPPSPTAMGGWALLAPKLICCPVWGVLEENGRPYNRLQAASYQILGKRIDTGTLGSSSVPMNALSSPMINTLGHPCLGPFLSYRVGNSARREWQVLAPSF